MRAPVVVSPAPLFEHRFCAVDVSIGLVTLAIVSISSSLSVIKIQLHLFFAEFDAVIKKSGESFLVQQHRLNEDLVFHREPAA